LNPSTPKKLSVGSSEAMGSPHRPRLQRRAWLNNRRGSREFKEPPEGNERTV
jgi:hypothetical protein